MTRGELAELSDDELRARLEQRGVHPQLSVDAMVANRDREDVAGVIVDLLG